MFRHEYNALVAPVEPNLSDSLEKTLRYAFELDEEEKASIRSNTRACLRKHYSLSAMWDGYSELLCFEPNQAPKK